MRNWKPLCFLAGIDIAVSSFAASPYELTTLVEAVLSATLLVSLLFIFRCLIGGAAERSQMAGRLLGWLTIVAFAVLLTTIWGAKLLTHQVLSINAIALLAESSGQAMLHLLQTDITVLCVVAFMFGAMLFIVARALSRHPPANPSSDGNAPRKGLNSAALISIAVLFASSNLSGAAQSPLLAIWKSALFHSVEKEALAESLHERLVPRAPAKDVVKAAANGTPVIFILVESLRRDLLTSHGDAIPFLSGLAKESMVFDRAYAVASHSDYSDLSVWYSRYPIRARRRLGYPADAPWRGVSLFEHVRAHGYETAYFSSQNERWGGMIGWLEGYGIDRFFHSENYQGKTWENEDDEAGLIRLIRQGRATAGKVEDSETLRLAFEWLRERPSKPLLLGLNLQNTHYSYVIPPGGREPYQPSDLGFRKVYYSWPAEYAPQVKNRYLNAVHNVDAQLARFASQLQKIGLWDKSLVIVLGDNGEAFYEHGFGNHSGPMYDEVVRTLALVKYPKGNANNGTVVSTPISHIDFVPLVLEALSLPQFAEFQGMLPAKRDGKPVFMHSNAIVHQDGMLKHPWKLLVTHFPNPKKELFNLEQDPSEQRNLYSDELALATRLEIELARWAAEQVRYYREADLYKDYYPPTQ